MSNTDFGNVVNHLIWSVLDNVQTVEKGYVLEYKPPLVNVRVSNKQSKTGGGVESSPILYNVPVVWFGTKDVTIHVDLKKDDRGLILFTKTSNEAWSMSSDLETIPQDPNQFVERNAVFIPGLYPASANRNTTDKTGLVLKNKTIDLQITDEFVEIFAEQTYMKVDKSGIINLGGKSKHFVSYEEFATKFALMMTLIQTHGHLYAPGPSAPVTTGPSPELTALNPDISDSMTQGVTHGPDPVEGG